MGRLFCKRYSIETQDSIMEVLIYDMQIKEGQFELKDGRIVLLKSPDASDAARMITYLKTVSGETEYMIRYPEEVTFTVEEEQALLDRILQSEREFMINAVFEDRVIGNVGITMMGDKYKLRHRASLGIAVIREFWQLGLGRELMHRALYYAKNADYEQIELGVYEDNPIACSLYTQLGFEQTGMIPRAFHLKNGRYVDEVQMINYL